MARARDIGQAASERTLRLSALVGQWEQDLAAVYDSPQVPGLAFDDQGCARLMFDGKLEVNLELDAESGLLAFIAGDELFVQAAAGAAPPCSCVGDHGGGVDLNPKHCAECFAQRRGGPVWEEFLVSLCGRPE